MTSTTPDRLLEIARATINAAEFCFLISLSLSGWANARLMQPFDPEPDLTIWFGASLKSRKVQEIQKNKRVTLGYSYPQEGAYVALSGTAAIETDMTLRRRYWRDSFAEFWPAGPEEDDYVLIKFLPSRIELMHIAQGIAPEPYGLRPVVLVRSGEDWLISEDLDPV